MYGGMDIVYVLGLANILIPNNKRLIPAADIIYFTYHNQIIHRYIHKVQKLQP